MRTTNDQKVSGLQKELRTRLYETALRIQSINAARQEQVKQAIDEICELIGFAKLTSVEEEKSLFPAFAITAPFMVTLLEQEKEKINEISEKLCINIEQWENSIATKEKQRMISLIQFSYNEWMVNFLFYLNKQQLLQIENDSEEKIKLVAVAAA